MAVSASALAPNGRSRSWATPYSVTTMSTSVRRAVTTSTFGTMREAVPRRALAVMAMMERPSGLDLAARMKSTEPPVPEICRPPTASPLTWPVRSTSMAELMETNPGSCRMTAASWV